MSRKFVVCIFIMVLFLMFSGCGDSKNTGGPEISNPPAASAASASPTVSGSQASGNERVLNELSMEAYNKFLKNEASICFDRSMPINNRDRDNKYLFSKGREYTLSEVTEKICESYLSHSENKELDLIEYGYIDCGNDGVNELIMRFGSLDFYSPDDDSTLVFVIKYINDKLYLCHHFMCWLRNEASVNEYGYYEASGKDGASTFIYDYGYIDKDGNWHPIAHFVNEFADELEKYDNPLNKVPGLIQERGIMEEIEFQFTYLNAVSGDNISDKDCFYTFYVYNNEGMFNYPSLYVNSIYKEIFDVVGVPVISPGEVEKKISFIEKQAGVTEEIKEGKDVVWNKL